MLLSTGLQGLPPGLYLLQGIGQGAGLCDMRKTGGTGSPLCRLTPVKVMLVSTVGAVVLQRVSRREGWREI